MNFLRHNDDIINLERITRICKKEVIYERTETPRIGRSYSVIFSGDDHEIKIRCDSEKEADKMIDEIWEIVKKCSRWYCF